MQEGSRPAHMSICGQSTTTQEARCYMYCSCPCHLTALDCVALAADKAALATVRVKVAA